MRDNFLGDARPRGFNSGLPGGVDSLTPLDTFLGEGELEYVSISLIP